ncbi:unnamed protein product [Clavelina lepadiformis]|uniref:GRIP domain-containing protein n=1 Tax=Clavelina lepadiformis TaxID=159417 RepID=A0ABP0FP43_CLALP
MVEVRKLINKLKQLERSESDSGFQLVHEDELQHRAKRTFSGGSHDAAEYADVISSQREINSLAEELERSKKECQRWKTLAQSSQETGSSGEDALRAKIKEFEVRLHEEVDRHQQEYISLQQANAATLRRYQDENRILLERFAQDPNTSSSDDSLHSKVDGQSHQVAIEHLTSEIEELKERLRTRNRQLQAQKKSLSEIRKDFEEERKKTSDLESEIERKDAEMIVISQEKESAESEVDKRCEQLQHLVHGVTAVLPKSDEISDDPSNNTIISCVRQLRESHDQYQDELLQAKENLAAQSRRSANQDDLAESDQWHIEGSDTEEERDERTKDEQVGASSSREIMRNIPPHMMQPLFQSSPQPSRRRSRDHDDNFLIVSENNVENVQHEVGDLTLTLQALQKQVDDYELEIAQYEMVKKEWQGEKESLQTMLERYEKEIGRANNNEDTEPADDRSTMLASLKHELHDLQEIRLTMEKDKLRLLEEKEQLQTAAQNLHDELNMSIRETQTERDNLVGLQSDLEKALNEKKKLEEILKNVSDELNSSRMEKMELDEAIETLDTQHQDEMTQILEIRNELGVKLKACESRLKEAQEENALLKQEMVSIKNDSELNNVREDLAALVDEKSSLEEQLHASQEEVSVLQPKVQEADQMMLNSEMITNDLKMKLEAAEEENKQSGEKFKHLEEENEEFIADLQKQLEEYTEALERSASRVDVVEEQRRKMEEEQKATLSKMDDLKAEHEKVIQEVDLFQEEKRKSDEGFKSLIKSKEDEVVLLRSELELLLTEEKKRIEELTQHHEHEAATSQEVSALKNEVMRIQERLESSIQENEELKSRNQSNCAEVRLLQVQLDGEHSKVKSLEEELSHKRFAISNLEEQLRSLQEKLSSTVEETMQQCEVNIQDLKTAHDEEVANMLDEHKKILQKLSMEHNAQLENMNADSKRDLEVIMEERDRLKEEQASASSRIKMLEAVKQSDSRMIEEKLQQSNQLHLQQMLELTESNKRFVIELDQERHLVEKLESDIKTQNQTHQHVLQDHEKVLEEIRSIHYSEKSALECKHMEEKHQFEQLLRREVENLKSKHKASVDDLQAHHEEEIQNKVAELNSRHQTEISQIHELLAQAKDEVVKMEAVLIQAQDDLAKLSELRELEKIKFEEDAATTVEKLNASHQEELVRLKLELEDSNKRNQEESSTFKKEENVTNELFLSLEQKNRDLLDEIKTLEAFQHQQQASGQLQLKEKITEITDLKNELSEAKLASQQLKSSQDSSDVEVNKLTSRYEDEIKALQTELKNLKLASLKSENLPAPHNTADIHEMLKEIRARDLTGLEKADLSKDDIGSLLALIKERDDFINILYEKNNNLLQQNESKAIDPELENQCSQLLEEKEQMLNVLSEKSRENRQLKEEVQKMMDVVTTGKNALSKLQEENQALVTKYEGYDHEMTKETVTRLSKLISEKDLEIESLKQKCQTLLDVLQQQESRETSGNVPSKENAQQIQGLLRDRETLSQQIRQLLTERDHLVALVNSKHQEALLFQDEAQKAVNALDRDAAENSQLQITYSKLVQDYEQLEAKLYSVQKELVRFKESLNHLEETKEVLLSKLDVGSSSSQALEAREVMENLRSDSTRSSGAKSKEDLVSILEKKTEALLQKDILLQNALEESSQLERQMNQFQSDIREKDIIIHKKMEESTHLSKDLQQKTNEVSILRKSVENLREQVSGLSKENESLREKISYMEHSSEDKESESQAFQETNAQLSVMLKERDYELESLREKTATLNEILLRHEQGKESQSQNYLKELDLAKEQAASAKHERDQIMLTLKQKQIEYQRANDELRQLRDKEVKLQSELSRLRSHLVQVEETYTQEAVLSREREDTLRSRLGQIENRNATALEANEHSKQQVESLQEQIRSTVQQRDQAIHNYQLAKEQSSQYATALQQLQMAAERMQRDEAATYNARVDKINQQYSSKIQQADALAEHVTELKAKLDEANVALVSASRLNEQLETKERNIDQLKELVSEKQLQLEELQDTLHKINAKSENMVDKQLVKNLLIGYFQSPANKKDDVIHLISLMIGFSKDEEVKLHEPKKGWIGGWIPWGKGGQGSFPVQASHSHSSHHEDLNESFSQMFVKFLESESASKQHAKLPAFEMVNEAQQRMTQRKIAAEGIPTPAFNPPRSEPSNQLLDKFTVAGRFNPFLVSSAPGTGTSSSSTSSHPLMQPLSPILPAFAPVSNTKPRDILQGILQGEGSTS